MKYIYTATFETDEDTGAVYARVPDLSGCVTSGKDLPDAIDLITDAASVWLVAAEDHGDPIPDPTPQPQLEARPGMQYSLIQVDTFAYRALTDSRAVRKNVSIPAWMANLSDRYALNCSQILQESLAARLQSLQARQ